MIVGLLPKIASGISFVWRAFLGPIGLFLTIVGILTPLLIKIEKMTGLFQRLENVGAGVSHFFNTGRQAIPIPVDMQAAMRRPEMSYNPAGMFAKTTPLAAYNQSSAVTVHVHNPAIHVPEGTTAQQQAAIRAGAEAQITEGLMTQVNKHLVRSIQKAHRG